VTKIANFDVGKNIREIRLMLDISQAELAKRVGLTPAAVSQIEGNERLPSLPSCVAFAKAFGVTLDRLIYANQAGKGQHQEEIGRIDVDSGTVYFGDPCYLISSTPWDDWAAWCKRFEKNGVTKVGHDNQATTEEEKGTKGICVYTAWGDGSYPVYAVRGIEGRIMKIVIDFDDQRQGVEDAK
jgi:transcriptional regulator with XRE-family HTH domain